MPLSKRDRLDLSPDERRFLQKLSDASQERMARLIALPPLTTDDAERQLDRYLHLLEATAPFVPGLNLGTSRRTATILRSLAVMHPSHRLISGAIRSFLGDDDDDEITGVMDPKLELRNACMLAVELGHHELIEI